MYGVGEMNWGNVAVRCGRVSLFGGTYVGCCVGRGSSLVETVYDCVGYGGVESGVR